MENSLVINRALIYLDIEKMYADQKKIRIVYKIVEKKDPGSNYCNWQTR